MTELCDPGAGVATEPAVGLSAHARSRLAYIALFAVVAAWAPYQVLVYRAIGLQVAAIGGVIAVGSIVGLASAPGWGLVSDRRSGAPTVLVAAAACAVAGILGLSQAHDLPAVFGSVILFSAGYSGLSPIIDARALELSGPERSGYGPLRAWGSLSYVVATAATGAAIDRVGIGIVFAIIAIALVATAAIGLSLHPEAAAHERTPDRAEAVGVETGAAAPGAGGLATVVPATASPATAAPATTGSWRAAIATFLVGAWLVYAGLSGTQSFLALRFAELGAPAALIGAAAALGAAVEVPIMLSFPRLAAKFGPERLVVVGALVFTVRAFVASVTTEPLVLVLMAGIGGIGFACFVVGGVTYVSRRVPRELAATAQGLFSGMAMGLGQVLAGSVGGLVAASFGLTGLFATAGLLGLVAAGVVALAIRQASIAGRTSVISRSSVSGS